MASSQAFRSRIASGYGRRRAQRRMCPRSLRLAAGLLRWLGIASPRDRVTSSCAGRPEGPVYRSGIGGGGFNRGSQM